MGFELGNGILYSNDKQLKLGDISDVWVEVDTLSPNEIPDLRYYLSDLSSASFSSRMTLTGLDCLGYKPFEPIENFSIEHNIEILVQARWHKKKRINKKWLKRYGMKPDTVKVKADACTISYNTQTGECEFEVDKLKYIWRQDQLRRNLKIEM